MKMQCPYFKEQKKTSYPLQQSLSSCYCVLYLPVNAALPQAWGYPQGECRPVQASKTLPVFSTWVCYVPDSDLPVPIPRPLSGMGVGKQVTENFSWWYGRLVGLQDSKAMAQAPLSHLTSLTRAKIKDNLLRILIWWHQSIKPLVKALLWAGFPVQLQGLTPKELAVVPRTGGLWDDEEHCCCRRSDKRVDTAFLILHCDCFLTWSSL